MKDNTENPMMLAKMKMIAVAAATYGNDTFRNAIAAPNATEPTAIGIAALRIEYVNDGRLRIWKDSFSECVFGDSYGL
jgi:hypothetical protein